MPLGLLYLTPKQLNEERIHTIKLNQEIRIKEDN